MSGVRDELRAVVAVVAALGLAVPGAWWLSRPAELTPQSWRDGTWRPYAGDSPFNTPIPADARRHPDSDRIIARLTGFGAPEPVEVGTAGTEFDFSHPVYVSTPGDPRFTLECYETAFGDCPIEGHVIRIPDAARPAAGGDAHLTVLDPRSGWEYDLYKVRSKPRGGGRLVFRFGGRTRLDGPGVGSAATAAGFGSAAGIVRGAELEGGRIEHALFLVATCVGAEPVAPATGNGRRCSQIGKPMDGAPPMGARIRLRMSPEEIARVPGTPAKRAILRAMARYGMYLGDTGTASWSVQLESPESHVALGFPDPVADVAARQGFRRAGPVRMLDLDGGVDWRRRLEVLAPEED